MSNPKRPFVLWFTGLSGSGKSTIANLILPLLQKHGLDIVIVDGDEVRATISKDLGFTREDINENHRRIRKLCQEYLAAGRSVIVSTVSPHREVREMARRELHNFIEVHCDSSFEVCRERDVKGWYKKAETNKLTNLIGKDVIYETPVAPEIRLETSTESSTESATKVINYLTEQDYLG